MGSSFMCFRWVELFCLIRESFLTVFPQFSPIEQVVSNFGNKLFVKDFVGLFSVVFVFVVFFFLYLLCLDLFRGLLQ